jgi:glycosyltransferase involved in cell wall biosynthesis
MKILIVVAEKYPSYGAPSKRISNYFKASQLEKNTVEVLPIYFNIKSAFFSLLCSPLIPIWTCLKVFQRVGYNSVVLIFGFGWVSKLAIILTSKLRSKPVAIELNEKPYSLSGSRRDIFLKYFNPLHEFCLKKIVYPLSDGFIVISDALLDYISKYKKNNAIVCKVPILVDFEYYQKRVEKLDCFVPFMLHTATINDHKDGMINVFRAFAKIVSEMGMDLHFYLTSKIGLPKTKNLVKGIVSDYKLENYVHFLGDLDEESLLAYQQHCSVVVINKVYSEQNKYNFATKLGEYLALGKPVITSQFGEVTNYLQNSISCIFADPYDVNDIAVSIMKILTDPAFSEKIGEKGKEIAKSEFDFRAQSKLINQFFTDLACN